MKLIEQNVSNARDNLTKTLRRMATGEDIAVVILKRGGDMQGVLISPREAESYFNWKLKQIRDQNGNDQHNDSSSISEKPQEPPPSNQDVAQSSQVYLPDLEFPDGLLPPEDFTRHYVRGGLPPETVLQGLLRRYGPHGLTPEEADRIVSRVVAECVCTTR